MGKIPKIKVNAEWNKAIIELCTLANKWANWDLQTSQWILQFLQWIEVDDKYFSDIELKAKEENKTEKNKK